MKKREKYDCVMCGESTQYDFYALKLENKSYCSKCKQKIIEDTNKASGFLHKHTVQLFDSVLLPIIFLLSMPLFIGISLLSIKIISVLLPILWVITGTIFAEYFYLTASKNYLLIHFPFGELNRKTLLYIKLICLAVWHILTFPLAIIEYLLIDKFEMVISLWPIYLIIIGIIAFFVINVLIKEKVMR